MSNRFFRSVLLRVGFALSAVVCAKLSAYAQTDQSLWLFEAAAPTLRATSCPAETQPTRFETIDLTVTPVLLGPDMAAHAALPEGVALAGGWHLSSPDRRFGGLSGLTRQDDGQLLSVSDMGYFIRFEPIDSRPVETAQIAPLRQATGRAINGKLTGDAEGLDYRDGIAFVSLERNFRVLAYDLAGCDAAARGIEIGDLPKRFDGRRIRANNGPEALTLRPNGTLRIGYEQPWEGFVVTGDMPASGPLPLTRSLLPASADPALRLVGLDTLTLSDGSEIQADLYRAYDRTHGNRNLITLRRAGEALPSISLQSPLSVDNFEAILLERKDDHVRIYILSDDNFSGRQKTLIYAFDIRLPEPD